MEDQAVFVNDGSPLNVSRGNNSRLEDDEEDFRSCCGDDDDDDQIWKETGETAKEEKPTTNDDLDEYSVKMFFKGVSITEAAGDSSGPGYSGIGVVMERKESVPLIQVQKNLDFYVESLVADYLALMEGLTVLIETNISDVYAFTDSSLLYKQVSLVFLNFLLLLQVSVARDEQHSQDSTIVSHNGVPASITMIKCLLN
ncbi:hypothetical protein LINGRAPRIM_LOCUS281 [Linum grandiflorum]